MLLDAIAIRHSGYVIAQGAMPAILARPLSRLGTDLFGMVEKVLKQFPEHADGTLIGFVNLGVVVEVLVEVLAQFKIQGATEGAIADEGNALSPHIVGGLNSGGEKAFLRGGNDIDNLIIDDLSDRVIAPAFVRERSELAFDLACGGRPNLDLAKEFSLVE